MLPPIARRFEHIRRQSDHIRPHPTRKSSSRTRRFRDLTRPILETILYCKIQHFASRLSPKMSRCAAPATKSHPPTSPNTAPATQNECHHWSASLPQTSFPMRGASKVTLQHHQILRLPRNLEAPDFSGYSLNCACTDLLLEGTVTLLNCYLTWLLLDWTVTLLYWTVTLLNWLYWSITLLKLYWSVTVLNCDCTELWLY